MELRTTRREVAGYVVLAVDGAADLAAAPILHDALQRLVVQADPGASIAIDLDGTTVLDDTSLGLFLGAAASARLRGCTLCIVCEDQRLQRRLTETRFDRAVDVVSSLGATVADQSTDVFLESDSVNGQCHE